MLKYYFWKYHKIFEILFFDPKFISNWENQRSLGYGDRNIKVNTNLNSNSRFSDLLFIIRIFRSKFGHVMTLVPKQIGDKWYI